MEEKELLELWCEFGIEREEDIIGLIPEMKAMQNLKENDSFLNIFQHSIYTFLSVNSNKLHIKLSCLLHDIGKIEMTRVKKDGTIDFNGHHILSVKIVNDILTRLGFEKEIIDKTLFLIKNHEKDWDSPTKKQVKRFVEQLKENDLTFEEYYDFLVANLSSKNFDITLKELMKLNILHNQYLLTYNLKKNNIDYNDLDFSESDIKRDIRLSSLKSNSFLLKEVHAFANKYYINNKFIFYNYLYQKYL